MYYQSKEYSLDAVVSPKDVWALRNLPILMKIDLNDIYTNSDIYCPPHGDLYAHLSQLHNDLADEIEAKLYELNYETQIQPKFQQEVQSAKEGFISNIMGFCKCNRRKMVCLVTHDVFNRYMF